MQNPIKVYSQKSKIKALAFIFALITLFTALPSSASVAIENITRYQIPGPTTSIGYSLIKGADNNMYFIKYGAPTGELKDSYIVKVSISGDINEYKIPIQNHGARIAEPWTQLTLGPDGNIWFTSYELFTPVGEFNEREYNYINKVTPDGQFTSYQYTAPSTEYNTSHNVNKSPLAITAGDDGNIWFSSGKVDGGEYSFLTKMNTSGIVQASYELIGTRAPMILLNHNNSIWGASNTNIIKVNYDGQLENMPIESGMQSIALIGKTDQAVWFNGGYPSSSNYMFAKVTGQGNVIEYNLNADHPSSVPFSLTQGPDGNIYFPYSLDKIGKLGEDGNTESLPLGLGEKAYPVTIVQGPDGNLWVTILNLDSNNQPINAEIIKVRLAGSSVIATDLPQAPQTGKETALAIILSLSLITLFTTPLLVTRRYIKKNSSSH